MKTILTELPMYGYWPGSVFMYVRGIEVCVGVWGVWACGVCVRVGCVCVCVLCVSVGLVCVCVCACGVCVCVCSVWCV